MTTVHEAFAEQLNATQPVTNEKIALMKANRHKNCWSEEEIKSYFENVIPDVSKLLFFMTHEQPETVPSADSISPTTIRLVILSCWDHELASMEEQYTVTSMQNPNLPRLELKLVQ